MIDSYCEFVQYEFCVAYYNDVIMSAMASQITGVYSMVCSGADKKYQSSASLAFVMWKKGQ